MKLNTNNIYNKINCKTTKKVTNSKNRDQKPKSHIKINSCNNNNNKKKGIRKTNNNHKSNTKTFL